MDVLTLGNTYNRVNTSNGVGINSGELRRLLGKLVEYAMPQRSLYLNVEVKQRVPREST